jgi:hypothetical protein
MSVKLTIDSNKCKFTNDIHSQHHTEEFLNFLAKQGILFEQIKQVSHLVAESCNSQETPLFAASTKHAELMR